MLAPLKDRSLIERDDGDAQQDGAAPAVDELGLENLALRLALRDARQTQRRSADAATRQIIAQRNEISRLQQLNARLQQRVNELESGQAIVSLGQQLMALAESNDQLRDAARRVWHLDRTLCAAHHECERLARERDAAVARLPPPPAG